MALAGFFLSGGIHSDRLPAGPVARPRHPPGRQRQHRRHQRVAGHGPQLGTRRLRFRFPQGLPSSLSGTDPQLFRNRFMECLPPARRLRAGRDPRSQLYALARVQGRQGHRHVSRRARRADAVGAGRGALALDHRGARHPHRFHRFVAGGGGLWLRCPLAWYFYPGNWIYFGLATLAGGLAAWRHRSNIQRLLAGTESRITFSKKKDPS